MKLLSIHPATPARHIVEPAIFTPHLFAGDDGHKSVCGAQTQGAVFFIGQDVIEMRPGELWLFTHYGRPPTDFRGNSGIFTDPIVMKSRDGGRTWGEPAPMGLPWSIDGFMSDGGVSVLRLKSGKVLFICHRNGSKYRAHGSHGLPVISESLDDGRTWAPARLLTDEPEDIQYLMNQRLIQLASGRLVLPICARDPRTPIEKYAEGCHPVHGFCYLSDDEGRTWRRSQGSVRPMTRLGVQEPLVGEYEAGRLLMVFRSGVGCHQACFSDDGGETWSTPQDTPLTAACSSLTMTRLPDGRFLLAYNHAKPRCTESYFPRTPLVYTTTRDGRSWSEPVLIDYQPRQQLIYPSLTPTREGLLVIYNASEDPGDEHFRFTPDGWKIGGAKRCIVPFPA